MKYRGKPPPEGWRGGLRGRVRDTLCFALLCFTLVRIDLIRLMHGERERERGQRVDIVSPYSYASQVKSSQVKSVSASVRVLDLKVPSVLDRMIDLVVRGIL